MNIGKVLCYLGFHGWEYNWVIQPYKRYCRFKDCDAIQRQERMKSEDGEDYIWEDV